MQTIKNSKGVYVTQNPTAKPLTLKEASWVRSLQRVLNACPGRIELVTTGGPDLNIIDKNFKSDLADGAAERDGIVLASIDGKPRIHGVS